MNKHLNNNRFSNWYTRIVKKAGLEDYSPVKGTMVIVALWFSIMGKYKRFI